MYTYQLHDSIDKTKKFLLCSEVGQYRNFAAETKQGSNFVFLKRILRSVAFGREEKSSVQKSETQRLK